MPPLGDSITTKKKKLWYYLPYLPTFCFIAEIVAVAVWDVNSRSALSRTRLSLSILGLSLDTALVWSGEALAFTVAMVVIFSVAMLALGTGRCVIAYQADRTGATRMGGRLIAWMWLDAIFIVFWFCLTLWLLLLLLGQCLWMAAAWGLNTSVKVGAASARANMAAGINGTILHTNETAVSCSLSCVDLAPFEWALQNQTCFCNLAVVDTADQAMKEALTTMEGSVAGAVMLLICGMWILMAAASEFGVTRRERQLLRRIAKARLAAGNTESAKLLPGGGASGGIVGFGKKNKSKNGLNQPQPSVLVDQETGEVLDVEAPPQSRAPPASRANTASNDGPSLQRSGSFIKAAKGIGKGIAKTGKAFEVMGSFLSRR